MLALAYDQVIFAEQFTGLSIGSTAIAERFQPALVALTAGATQNAKELQGAGKEFRLGDLEVGTSSANSGQMNAYTQDGMKKLQRIGRQFQVYKAWG